jgi:diphthamide biosynthesis protein 2
VAADDAALQHLRQHGWDAHTIVAASSYAGLAFIAIGYDEILPVYAATREDLGGLSLSASQIGLVLVVGGVALILFQLFAFPLVLKRLGVTKALRRASLAFACVALLAPVASVRGVVEKPAAKWFALLASQTLKIVTLAVLFTTVIMAVNNSCLNRVKARVNGAATSCAALGRIVSPVVHGVVFSASLRLHENAQQFLVFAFVSLCALALFALTSRLPSRLDQPPREAEDERAAGTEEDASAG